MWKIAIINIITSLVSFNCGFDVFSAGEGTTWSFGMKETPSHEATKDQPILVWWTTNLYPHVKEFDDKICPRSRCYVTKNRSYVNHPQTLAFYFYGTEYFDDKELPLPRKPHHIWGLAHEESPLNNFILDHAVGMNVFNYTATYHRAADYPITLVSFPGVEFILNRPPVSTALKNQYQMTKGHAPAVYVQSHCEVPSDRDRYIEELMLYMKVDSYGMSLQSHFLVHTYCKTYVMFVDENSQCNCIGKCLHNKDLPEHLARPVESMFNTQFKDLLAEYKFILSFENG